MFRSIAAFFFTLFNKLIEALESFGLLSIIDNASVALRAVPAKHSINIGRNTNKSTRYPNKAIKVRKRSKNDIHSGHYLALLANASMKGGNQ